MDIQEVARLAKVSTATVSRVINSSSKVRPETAARVQHIIEKTAYIPNRSARSLRVRHSRLFGLIVSDVKNPFFPELIDGFEALATSHGIDVIFTHTNYDSARLDHCLRRMAERNVDGIAVMTSETDSAALARIKRLNVPVVLLDQEPGCGFDNVLTDFDSGFADAVLHLKNLGHVDIGFIAGPEGFASVHRRRDAFILAMKTLRLKLHARWIVTGDLHIEGGQAAMEELLAMATVPTAVVTTNDLMAVGALQAAHNAGIDVPRELSIVGFDDLPVSAMLNPPLTTICMSRQEIASRAFSCLLKLCRIESKIPGDGHRIHPALTVRRSTAPPLPRTSPVPSRRPLRSPPSPQSELPGKRPSVLNLR
jgi:LacI family transcriptional regulator